MALCVVIGVDFSSYRSTKAKSSIRSNMKNIHKENAREMGFQLKRDFKFHLSEDIDLSMLTQLIDSGNSAAVEQELTRLTILYADKIKEQAGSTHC